MRSVCFLPLFAIVASVTASAAPGDVYTVANAATLRAGPGGQFPEIGTATSRNPTPLVEISRQGGWIETDHGWVWGPLVCAAGGTPADTAAAPETSNGTICGATPSGTTASAASGGSHRMVVAVDASYLRQAPKHDAKSEFRLGVGAEVVVSRTEGDWVRVSLGDVTGWMMRSQLKPMDATAAAALLPLPRKPALGTPAGSPVTLVGF
jgi:uncharacterized protein YraI